jgi:hypothetical protein
MSDKSRLTNLNKLKQKLRWFVRELDRTKDDAKGEQQKRLAANANGKNGMERQKELGRNGERCDCDCNRALHPGQQRMDQRSIEGNPQSSDVARRSSTVPRPRRP